MSGGARYKAVKRLHRGPFAEVLLAQDRLENDALVVVKRLVAEVALVPDAVALFEREIAIARTLDHPNVVRILEVSRAGNVPFYVMEHLEGADLRNVMLALRKRGDPMPAGVACLVGACIARGLAAAHATGIVHRDVKPANVFLESSGGVKVLDFGIARGAEHVALTRTGVTRGTHAYMAPEQHAGLATDARTDLFALGVVLWEMLTSRRLFKRDSPEAVVQAILHEPAGPPSVHARGVSSRAEAVVMAMLGKLPAGRPASAALIASVLEEEASRAGATPAAIAALAVQA